ADILILATPVGVIVDLLKKIGPDLKEGAIVVDLGSTKEVIEKSAKKYLPEKVYFVGCHPFCGSEKKGVEQAREDLYQKSICFITSKNKATALISKMWEKIGSRVVEVSPGAHDQITCLISHLPHLICFSLLNLVSDNYLKFSSSGFSDLTRIGSSSGDLWADIFLTNKEKLLKNINKYNQEIDKFKEAIKKNNRKKIKALIKKANQKRSQII
ncbi:MAG: prephenate dehydrogenase, partial [Candidatus Omnitrophica bacterium]|nr:prephenate dehydrogenase [Candidatus Omnitrophota bacterium]